MYTDNTPEFFVDLRENERDRWEEVIEDDVEAVAALAREVDEENAHLSTFVKKGISAVVAAGYRASGGRYQGELHAWAAALGISFGDMVTLNCVYELSHAADEAQMALDACVFGCTAGIRWVPGHGMVHVRSLDWPLRKIGRATRVFKYCDGERNFTTVGTSGYVGVLSGMLPGAYSVTINWAPADGYPSFAFGPSFLLREVLETCDTYSEAVRALARTPISTPVFFTVCGVRRGQACVIERSQKDATIRKPRGDVLVQANHHVARKFAENNTDEEILEFSEERVEALTQALSCVSTSSLEDVADCLDTDGVLNEDTQQQMVFCPSTGEVKVWRWV